MSQLIRTSKGHIQSQHITHTEIGTGTMGNQPNTTYLIVYFQNSYLKLWGEEAQQLIKWLDHQSCPAYLLGESEKI